MKSRRLFSPKERLVYEAEVKVNPLSYDNCIDYIRLEESALDVDRIK